MVCHEISLHALISETQIFASKEPDKTKLAGLRRQDRVCLFLLVGVESQFTGHTSVTQVHK